MKVAVKKKGGPFSLFVFQKIIDYSASVNIRSTSWRFLFPPGFPRIVRLAGEMQRNSIWLVHKIANSGKECFCDKFSSTPSCWLCFLRFSLLAARGQERKKLRQDKADSDEVFPRVWLLNSSLSPFGPPRPLLGAPALPSRRRSSATRVAVAMTTTSTSWVGRRFPSHYCRKLTLLETVAPVFGQDPERVIQLLHSLLATFWSWSDSARFASKHRPQPFIAVARSIQVPSVASGRKETVVFVWRIMTHSSFVNGFV